MQPLSFDEFRQLAEDFHVHKEGRTATYFRSYHPIVELVGSWPTLSEDNTVLLAVMAYGWMPTIPKLNLAALPDAAVVLRAAKSGSRPARAKELEPVRRFANNSVVGMSKILHFVAPGSYPIWDAKVARHFHAERNPSQVWINGCGIRSDRYMGYIQNCHSIVGAAGFPQVAAMVQQRVAADTGLTLVPFTSMRIIDLVLWAVPPVT